MSQVLEFIGKNMDEALDKASRELNIPVEKLEYDVVSYGSSGIFGLVGAKKAKIRIKEKIITPVERDAKSHAKDLVKDAFDLDEPKPSKPEVKEDPVIETQETASIDFDKAIAIGKEALERFADYITSDFTVLHEIKDQRIIFKIEGGKSGLLIGKRGQTLEAMQYLVEKIVNKQSEQRVRVLVDVEGYLRTRKINLQKMASRMADKAKKSNRPVTIGQMNAYDRRTVHMHLKKNNAVRTQSVGEGYYRKLIIFPKKRQKRRNNRHPN